MVQQYPANWYPDPRDSGLMRYFDGERWTEHTAPVQTPYPPQQPAPVQLTRRQLRQEQKPQLPEQAREVKIPLFGARSAAKDLAAENERLRNELRKIGALEMYDAKEELAFVEAALTQAQSELLNARTETERTKSCLLDVRNAIEVQEFGLYDYEHPAESSATLAQSLTEVRSQIKAMVKAKTAVTASPNFIFDNSPAKGKKFVSDLCKMALAAYNAEAEAAIKTVKAGGYATAKTRLERMAKAVATGGSMVFLQINLQYHNLRLQELQLAARHVDALKAEREAEREQRAALREQKKAEEELQKAKEKLQKEREHYLNALTAVKARGDEEAITELEAKLADADKAIADVDYRVANARAGYVYVISNIGSFGPNMVKIGMTRRLEPMDRVRELGDASVPFRFDVHALFFSEDAVGIETMLHQRFAKQRVNRLNSHREFFYVTPADVLDALKDSKVAIVQYRTEAEAEEYHTSIALAQAENSPLNE